MRMDLRDFKRVRDLLAENYRFHLVLIQINNFLKPNIRQ
jgi:hypothetical protein